MTQTSSLGFSKRSRALTLSATLLLSSTALGAPTWASPAAQAAQPATLDIAARLAAIEGMMVDEIDTRLVDLGYRRFYLRYTQPADHNIPDGETFEQSMVLYHKIDQQGPMVMNTLGYDLRLDDYILPLTYQLQGSSLSVEHRFFGNSMPASRDDRLLTIQQAAADHHRIAQALKPIYENPWISTGASKGGMTAIYFRRFYPEDVHGTVALVAPNSFGRADLRYPLHMLTVGTKECREKLGQLQRTLLQHQDWFAVEMKQRAESENTTFLSAPGGFKQAFQYAVAFVANAFWRYHPTGTCELLPEKDASLNWVFDTFWNLGTWRVLADQKIDRHKSYYVQAVRQLGYPAVDVSLFWWLLTENPNDYAPLLDGAAKGAFDWPAMTDIYLWNAFSSKNMMLIYGEKDLWTAGSFHFMGTNGRDVHRFEVDDGGHGVQIFDLAPQDKAHAVQALERWSGMTFRPLPRDPEAESYASGVDLYPNIDFPVQQADERFYEPGAAPTPR